MKKLFVGFIVLTVLLISVSGIVGAYYGFEDVYGDIDLGGATMRLVLHWNPLTDLENKHPGRIADAEEKFNVNIEFVGVPGERMEASHMNRLLAGESYHDVWVVSSENIWHYIAQDAILPVNEILPEDYYQSLPAEHQMVNNILSYQGNKYGFSTWGTIQGALRFIIFNREIFEEEGLRSPYEYYQEGNWTWDVLRKLATQLTRDNTGDGQIDQYGLGHANIYDFILSNGGRLFREEDERFVFTLDEENAINGLNEYYDWGNVSEIADYSDAGGGQFAAGRDVMFVSELWRLHFIEPDFEYGIVPFPIGPKEDRYTYFQPWFELMVLPANAENRIELMAITDYLFSSDNYNLQEIILASAPDRLAAEIVYEGVTSWQGDSNLLQSILPDEYTEALQDIINGRSTASAAINEIRGIAQETVDDFFNQ